jgi:uncharacterized membrane protein HdeD (DUF308 family)
MREEMHWHVYKGAGMLVLGLLILANAYWGFLTWGAFIGAFLALGGFIKLLMPHKKGRR